MTKPIEKYNRIDAIKEEINSLHENKTWELVKTPPGKHVIRRKWTFKAKYNSRGKIQKYKAHLVAKGFSQKHEIDYDETYASVASHSTMRVFLNMTVYKKP